MDISELANWSMVPTGCHTQNDLQVPKTKLPLQGLLTTEIFSSHRKSQCRMAFIIFHFHPSCESSISSSNSKDWPSLPPRAVRPTRWMYCCRLPGAITCTTRVTLGGKVLSECESIQFQGAKSKMQLLNFPAWCEQAYLILAHPSESCQHL